jgi:hypothetical protein
MKKVVTLVAALAAALALSCALDRHGVSLTLGLNVPELASAMGFRADQGAKMLAPGSVLASVRIAAAGFSYNREHALVPGTNTLEIQGIPLGAALDIDIDVYDAASNLVSSVSATVVAGEAPVSLSLQPNLALASTWAPAGDPAQSAAGQIVPLQAGIPKLVAVEVNLASPGEYCFAVDDAIGSPWMRLYDASGAAFPTLAEDPDDGWAAISLPAGASSFVAAIACARGEPTASVNFFRARFVDTVSGQAGSAGSSSLPKATIWDALSGANGANYAVFVRGSASIGQQTFSLPGYRARLHGAFTGSTDWKARDLAGSKTVIRATGSASPALGINAASGCAVSGFDIGFIGISNAGPRTAVTVSASAYPAILSDCVIAGPSATAGVDVPSSIGIYASTALSATLALIECDVRAGTAFDALSQSGYLSSAIRLQANTPLYARGCRIDGGLADGGVSTSSTSFGISTLGDAPITILASIVRGGRASAGGNAVVNAITAGSAPLIVISSIVSGGIANGGFLNEAIGIKTGASLRCFGSTIVGGTMESAPTDNRSAAIESSAGTHTGSVLLACALVAPINAVNASCAYFANAAASFPITETLAVTAGGNAVPWAYMYTNYSFYAFAPTPVAGGQIVTIAANLSTFFAGWEPAVVGFDNWLAENDFTPTLWDTDSRCSKNPIADTTINATFGLNSLLASFPELARDAKGRDRGTDWTRGALEY